MAQAGSWRLDVESNEESWSDGMLALFDVDTGDFKGDAMPIMEKRVLAADLAPVLKARATTSQTGEPLPLEFRVRRRDGSERVIHSQGTAERDETGQVVAMTGYCQDVTDLRQSALRLEAAALEWSETFDAMSDAVALLDSGGRVVRCNAATLEVTGLYIDDIVGHRCDEILHLSRRRRLRPPKGVRDWAGPDRHHRAGRQVVAVVVPSAARRLRPRQRWRLGRQRRQRPAPGGTGGR